MADHAQTFTITKMSQVFSVSRSGYYKWASRTPSRRSLYNQQLRVAIREQWILSKKIYGAPRIHQELERAGWTASRPRVARLMRRMEIASQIRAKWVQTTESTHRYPVVENLLDRNFTPQQLNCVWVSDITYIPSKGGWLYLTTILDLADRQIIGWSLSRSMKAKHTSIAAFKQARVNRPPGSSLLFHSDRGVQYACGDFTKLLAEHEIIQSMSRKGNCWDNAPAESFFKTLKSELDMPMQYKNYQSAKNAIFSFIEIWYNRKRRHSTLDYQTPAEAEQTLKQKQAA